MWIRGDVYKLLGPEKALNNVKYHYCEGSVSFVVLSWKSYTFFF